MIIYANEVYGTYRNHYTKICNISSLCINHFFYHISGKKATFKDLKILRDCDVPQGSVLSLDSFHNIYSIKENEERITLLK